MSTLLGAVLTLCAAQTSCDDAAKSSGSGGDGDGGGGTSEAVCATDADCDSGEACHRSDSEGYCAPLCDDAGDCENSVVCPSGEPGGAFSCDEQGDHDGRGVCDRFEGAFGPSSCGDAVPGCNATANGVHRWCYCSWSTALANPPVPCPQSDFSRALCCASSDWGSGQSGSCVCEDLTLYQAAEYCGSGQLFEVTAKAFAPDVTPAQVAACDASAAGVCCDGGADGCFCTPDDSCPGIDGIVTTSTCGGQPVCGAGDVKVDTCDHL